MANDIFVTVTSDSVKGGVLQVLYPSGDGRDGRVFGPFPNWDVADHWATEELGLTAQEFITFRTVNPDEATPGDKTFHVEVETVITVEVEARNDLQAEEDAYDVVERELSKTALHDWVTNYADAHLWLS